MYVRVHVCKRKGGGGPCIYGEIASKKGTRISIKGQLFGSESISLMLDSYCLQFGWLVSKQADPIPGTQQLGPQLLLEIYMESETRIVACRLWN